MRPFTNGATSSVGMNISEAKRLRQLEKENALLKRLVGEQALDIVVLKNLVSKKLLKPQPTGKSCITFRLRRLLRPAGLPSDSV